MGLYLCIFDGDDEIDGVEVGPYADFGSLRQYITKELEGGKGGSVFPTFILHSDCDGEWAASECVFLGLELQKIEEEMKRRPPIPFVSDWQKEVAKSHGIVPTSAFESFIDVDGQKLLKRIRGLIALGIERGLPILFQ